MKVVQIVLQGSSIIGKLLLSNSGQSVFALVWLSVALPIL